MNTSDAGFEVLSRRRVRLGIWIASSFLLVLAAIAANDALVQAHMASSAWRVAVLVALSVAGALLVGSLARFAWLTRRSFADARLRRKLWDELARANHGQSMLFAYFAMLFVLVILAVISMFTTLSAPWAINATLLTALVAQAASFCFLERRGDHAGE